MEVIRLIADLFSLAEILWGIGGAAVAMLGWIMFGPRYKQRIADLEAALADRGSPVTVNVQGENPSPLPPLVDPTIARYRSSHELRPLLEVHTTGESFPHDRIWELHLALGERGIPWPGPGVTPAFRRAVSEEILAALRGGDQDRARAAWHTVKSREAPGAPTVRMDLADPRERDV